LAASCALDPHFSRAEISEQIEVFMRRMISLVLRHYHMDGVPVSIGGRMMRIAYGKTMYRKVMAGVMPSDRVASRFR
jgi:hypothetical protein